LKTEGNESHNEGLTQGQEHFNNGCCQQVEYAWGIAQAVTLLEQSLF